MARKTFATLAEFKAATGQQMAQPPNSSDPDITGTGPVVEVVISELGAQVYYWCSGNTEPADDITVIRQSYTYNGVTTPRTDGAWKVQEGSAASIEDGVITSAKLAAVFGLGNKKVVVTSATGAVDDLELGAKAFLVTGADSVPAALTPGASKIVATDSSGVPGVGSDARDRQKVTLTITRAMVTGLGGGVKTYQLAAGSACPAGARLLGYEVASITGWDDATHGTYGVEIGAITSTDVMGSVSVAAGETGFPKAGGPGALGYPCAPIGGATLSVLLTSSVDLNTATVGSVTVNVFYSVMP